LFRRISPGEARRAGVDAALAADPVKDVDPVKWRGRSSLARLVVTI
jgi:hypothetical protein